MEIRCRDGYRLRCERAALRCVGCQRVTPAIALAAAELVQQVAVVPCRSPLLTSTSPRAGCVEFVAREPAR